MNISLVYQGNNFNFDLRKDVNIKYIQDLASKLISKDSSNLDLLYKNNYLSDYPNTTLIKDLIKDDGNVSIIITQKDKNNELSSDNQSKLKKKDLDQSKNSFNSKKILNLTSASPIQSQKRNQSVNQQLTNNIFHKKINEYISKNKVFEEVYNLKENEIFSLMKNLSQKIKEYDAFLFKQFKNNPKCELSLYEKHIIDFKDKQIKFLKKLLTYFDTNEKEFETQLSLTEFYKDLKQYNNPKKIMLNNNNECNKSTNLNNIKKNISKTDSIIKIKETNNIRKYNQDKKLPLLPHSKLNNGNKYFLSQNNNTISSVDSNENNSDFVEEKNFFKDHILNSENKPKKYKIFIKPNKNNILNTKDNKEKEKEKESNSNSKNVDNKKITKNNNNSNITDNKINNNNNSKKAISLCNTNDQTNTTQSTSMQGKVLITNINNKKNQSIKKLLSTSNNQLNQRLTTIINHKKENKINALFDEENNYNNINKDNNSSSSESSDKIKRQFSNDSKNNNKNYSKISEENNYIFRKTKKSKKNCGKYKNITNNIYDFLI